MTITYKNKSIESIKADATIVVFEKKLILKKFYLPKSMDFLKRSVF